MNPCPCGYYNHPTKACVCSPGQVQKYLNRISGPLLDRIDLQIEVIPVPFEKMSDARPGESSTFIRERAYDRILKVSRTIADLEGCELIQPSHLAEAIGYRNLDREDWAG